MTLPAVGRYYLWQGERSGVLQAVRTNQQGKFSMQLPNPGACACGSGFTAEVDKAVAEEAIRQEQAWSVISGMRQYKRINGSWPRSLDDLTKDYPNNILAGTSPGMKEHFSEWLERAMEPAAGGGKDGQTDGNQGGRIQSSMNGTLILRVDTRNHLIALMSGSVVVRLYPAGPGRPQNAPDNVPDHGKGASSQWHDDRGFWQQRDDAVKYSIWDPWNGRSFLHWQG